MIEHDARIHLGGSLLGAPRHLCAFSRSVTHMELRTHAAVMTGGILQENPFFAPPDEFLRELGAGRGA
jgi:hypothetical protein